MPLQDGELTPAALAQARIVARMRARGHRLDLLRGAAREGRLAYGYLEELFPREERRSRSTMPSTRRASSLN